VNIFEFWKTLSEEERAHLTKSMCYDFSSERNPYITMQPDLRTLPFMKVKAVQKTLEIDSMADAYWRIRSKPIQEKFFAWLRE